MGFASDIQAKIDKINLQVNNRIYSYAQEYFSDIVYLTPVKTGLLSNSWYPTESSSPSGAVGNITGSAYTESITRIDSIGGQEVFLGKDGTITLANNQFYGVNAEYSGWHVTGPYAMIANATTGIQSKYGNGL